MNVDAAGTGQDSTGADNQQTTDDAGATPPADQQQNTTEVNYEFKMPEGVELDKDAAEEFKGWAKEHGLKPDQAQKVADIGAKMMQKQAEAHARTVNTWIEQVKADKDIGGDKLEENLAIARQAIEAFGTPELKDVLNSTGLGNHPAIIKAFVQAGKRISQDTFVAGKGPSGEKDAAKTLFPTMN